MTKSPDAFRTISEVAEWLGVQAHVLRFWESKFTQVKPVKRAGGRRYYRPADMQLLGGIKKLLHDDGMTIKGVQKLLRENGVAHVAAMSPPLDLDAPGPDAEETVIPFKSRTSRRETGGDVNDLIDLIGLETDPRPEDARAEAAPEDPVAETPSEAEPADRPPAPPPAEPRVEAPPEPAAEAAGTGPAARPDKPRDRPHEAPVLPSFLHQPGTAAGKTDRPAPPPRRPSVVDAPDPPADETALPYAPGILATAARLRRLTPEQAREIAPLAEDLRAWATRAMQAGLR